MTLGYTMLYLSLIVLIPLSATFIRSLGGGWEHFWDVVTAPRVVASLRLSFGAALLAAAVNAVFGLVIAWVLVRYTFPFKRLIDAMVDLPFALPTAVAGIALTALYAPNGWLGRALQPLGIHVAFTPDPIFGLPAAASCPEVPPELLKPRTNWSDPSAYDARAKHLAGLFAANFKQHAAGVGEGVRQAGPRG